MTSREQQYLLDILIAAEDALAFVDGMTFEAFESNALVKRAVVQCLTVIGEAAARITRLGEAAVPDLPWLRMKNLRNVLVHEYEGVNLPIVWQVVQIELPAVLAALDPLFPERKNR